MSKPIFKPKIYTMTPSEKKIMADLIEACRNATGYFNAKAQSQMLGLSNQDDDLRQQLCNAVSAATGTIYCGNLTRTHEAQHAINQVKQMHN